MEEDSWGNGECLDAGREILVSAQLAKAAGKRVIVVHMGFLSTCAVIDWW